MTEFENRLNHLLLNFSVFLCLAQVHIEMIEHGFKKSLYFAISKVDCERVAW